MSNVILTTNASTVAMGSAKDTVHKPVETATFGADPELMLFDIEQNKMVSAIGVLKNDKYAPMDLGDGIKMYADNVLAEFSFPPVTSRGEFIGIIRKALQRGQEVIGKRLRFVAKAAHVYDNVELSADVNGVTEDGKSKALEGGCSPNFDVYAGKANLPPRFDGGLRTGSFHIHVGHSVIQPRAKKDFFIKLMDMNVGFTSLMFDHDPSSHTRRKLYGKAGEFRPTPYGAEYRVLGPYVLRSPDLVRLAWDLTNRALVTALTEEEKYYGWPLDISSIANSINNAECPSVNVGYVYLGDRLTETIHELPVPDLYRDWDIKV